MKSTPDTRHATNILLTWPMDSAVGGMQVFCRDLVRLLEAEHRTVHLLHPSSTSRWHLTESENSWGRRAFYCPMPVVHRRRLLATLPVFLFFLPLSTFQLVRLIRRNKIDVINGHYLSPYFLYLVIAARLCRVRVVVSVHGSDVTSYPRTDWVYRLFAQAILRHADRIVACSAALARQAADIVPQGREKVVCIHNALDPTSYEKGRVTTAVQQPYILAVGRHHPVKGFDVLIRAFASIAAEVPELSLALIGDGPLLGDHQALATELGVAHRVRFLGVVQRSVIGSFLEGCAVFVLPSRAEAFGLALLEAAYYGKPIVGTRVGGVPEIIVDGVSGVLVEPEDPEAMGREILGLLRQPERARRMGNEAHEVVVSRFLFRDRIGDYLAVYDGRSRAGVPGAAPGTGAHGAGVSHFGRADAPEIRRSAARPERDSAVLH